VSLQTPSLALLIAGLVFLLFLLLKLLGPPGTRGQAARAARERIAAAKRRASDGALSAAERAAALREAALIAMEELRRPGLAASYARRAERLDPDAAEGLALLSLTLRGAARYQALERLLWRRLAAAEPRAAATERALHELLSLYEGPLRRPEVARALRRLHSS